MGAFPPYAHGSPPVLKIYVELSVINACQAELPISENYWISLLSSLFFLDVMQERLLLD